jgi:hypothetical protein
MNLSKHATERSLSRGIPEVMIDVILKFGGVEHHKGSEIYKITKKGEREARHYLGNLYSNELKEIYVVVKADTVVTVARQTVHHKRQRH